MSGATRRVSGDGGFGMVELLIAMTVLAAGILVVFGMFNAATLQIRRAATVSTATAIADGRLEDFRSMKFAAIGLLKDGPDGVANADARYKADAAYRAVSTPENQTNSAVTITGTSTKPTSMVTGPDRKLYRVDTYVTWQPVSTSSGRTGRNVKLVTVVVRDGNTPSVAWARRESSFDEATGR
jgi:type II secretory pathway pseudopilin PulG